MYVRSRLHLYTKIPQTNLFPVEIFLGTKNSYEVKMRTMGEERRRYLPVELSLWSNTCDPPTAEDKDAVKDGPLRVRGRGRGVDLLSASQPLGPGVACQTEVELHWTAVVDTADRQTCPI